MPKMKSTDAACRDVPASPLAAAAASPLMICDRLISLAQDADRAGYAATAGRLVLLANRIFDEKRAFGPPA